MTLVTHIAAEKIQLIIADSLCYTPQTKMENFACQKIHNYKTFVVAKYGNYPPVIKAFLLQEEEKQQIKSVEEFISLLKVIIERNKDEPTTNLLIQEIGKTPVIYSISKNEITPKTLFEAGKSPNIPDWVFFSPIKNLQGGIDYEYQVRLSDHLQRVIREEFSLKSHNDLNEEMLEDFVRAFLNPITSKKFKELNHDTIGGEKIWYAFSITGREWEMKKIDLVIQGPMPLSDEENLRQFSELIVTMKKEYPMRGNFTNIQVKSVSDFLQKHMSENHIDSLSADECAELLARTETLSNTVGPKPGFNFRQMLRDGRDGLINLVEGVSQSRPHTKWIIKRVQTGDGEGK